MSRVSPTAETILLQFFFQEISAEEAPIDRAGALQRAGHPDIPARK